MNNPPAPDTNSKNLTELTAEVVSAYVAHNSLPAGELPNLLSSVYVALGQFGAASPAVDQRLTEEIKPAVPIRKSVTDDYLISLEDGQKFKSLKRHLMTSYGMTPEQYREKWGLPKDYPMVAPAYAKSRSALAKSLGLGRKISAPAPAGTKTKPAAKGRNMAAAA